ncbi:Os06g0355300 [Oryza sativa Japonica Group]|uniref:Os06g0355300 protein n=1 Tax=Oryza sativa subsp. japonica TaxID=39947 RepID=A0A0N7KM32_ORYSJ|nr:hypothetical protein EE612_034005 [Oryza sativa]BAS97689.1 Os06g0355300 [Oryza sativa Japonica Group]
MKLKAAAVVSCDFGKGKLYPQVMGAGWNESGLVERNISLGFIIRLTAMIFRYEISWEIPVHCMGILFVYTSIFVSGLSLICDDN